MPQSANRMQIGYVSWKHWHSPKNHLLGLAVVQAYLFYLEILTAPEALQYIDVTPEEAKKALYSMLDFVQHLSTQGLKYDPHRKKFRLDVLLWTVHMTDTRDRARRRIARSVDNALGRAGHPQLENSVEPGVMSKALYSHALGDLNLGTSLVGDLDTLTQHLLKSFDKTHSNAGKKCKWCNLKCYTYCALCPGMPPLHFFCNRGAAERKLCAIHYHNSQSYGLVREDATAGVSLPVRDWAEATEAHMALHSEKITAICQELQDDEEEEAAQDDDSIEVHHI
jgi:hypothetical protein